MNLALRCCSLTVKNKRCSNKKYKEDICYIHYKNKCNKFVIMIQKIWNSFRCRKKLKNLYYNLPIEIKDRVLYYMRYNHNIIYKFLPVYNTIIRSKLHNLSIDLYIRKRNLQYCSNEVYDKIMKFIEEKTKLYYNLKDEFHNTKRILIENRKYFN